MFNFLKPDFYFHSVFEVPLSFYKDNGVKAILFDIDNTLEPYATLTPSDRTRKLFESLRADGIKIAVVSNNHEARVNEFCRELNVPYSYDSGKPSSKHIKEFIRELDATESEVIMIGDQLFTDIWAANNSGIRGMLVDRINSDESAFIKFKRALERPFIHNISRDGYGRKR